MKYRPTRSGGNTIKKVSLKLYQNKNTLEGGSPKSMCQDFLGRVYNTPFMTLCFCTLFWLPRFAIFTLSHRWEWVF